MNERERKRRQKARKKRIGEDQDFSLVLRESRGLVPEFTATAKERLLESGYQIASLGGGTMLEIAAEGIRHGLDQEQIAWILTHHPAMWNSDEFPMRSRKTEVAINPQNLYLLSPTKDIQTSLETIRTFSESIRERISPDVEAIMGDIPDYFELEIINRVVKGEALFDYSSPSFGMIPLQPYSNFAIKTPDGGRHSLAILFLVPERGHVVAPLVVPRVNL